MKDERITAKIDREIHRSLKIEAARTGCKLQDMLDDAVRAYLSSLLDQDGDTQRIEGGRQ